MVEKGLVSKVDATVRLVMSLLNDTVKFGLRDAVNEAGVIDES